MEGKKIMIDEISKLARAAGQMMIDSHLKNNSVYTKEGKGNFTTDFDIKIQNFIKEELNKLIPDAAFIGEENGQDLNALKKLTFIVDPIDGTTNFIRNYRHSCVSICLMKDYMPYIGVVYNPYLDELFCAQINKGASLNNKPIHVSENHLSDSVISFGTSPYNTEKADQTFETAKILFKKAVDIRRCGSAALDICYVAAGRCDLYFEYILSPWDFAAASLILSQAGGIICTSGFNEIRYTEKCAVMAANRVILDEIKDLIIF